MDSPLLILVVAIFFDFCALIAESQGNVSPPPPVFPPPPLPLPPPPPPPPRPFTPPAPTPPPSPPTPAPPHPPPGKRVRPPPPPGYGDHKYPRTHLSPPPKKGKLNKGKKIGLMFIGVAALLQVFVVSFLLISRRQLLKAERAY